MSKIRNLYYDVFTDETIQRKRSDWYWLGYKDFKIEGRAEGIGSPAQEMLNAIRDGEWEFVKVEGETYLREKTTGRYFNFIWNLDPDWEYVRLSVTDRGGSWVDSYDFCTAFEKRSIVYGLHIIKAKLERKKKDLQKEKLIEDFRLFR